MKTLNYSETLKKLRNLLKDYIIKANLKSLVLGISGGIDSALVAAIAKPVCDELGIPLIGRFISIESNKEDERERAINISKCFCTDFKEIDLTEHFNVLKSFDEDSTDREIAYKIRMGNIKARMRMTYLMNLSSKFEGLVLGTENLCEHYLGFFTIGGDEISGFEPIKGLWKYEVYNLSEYMANNGTSSERDALMSCITCNATDGLGISNTDLDQILPDWKDRHTSTRSAYKEVDEIFIGYFDQVDILLNKKQTISIPETMKVAERIMLMKEHPVIQRYFKSEFKRRGSFTIERKDIIFE